METRKLHIMDRGELDRLIGLLREASYTVIGGRVREGALRYEPIACLADLPVGFSDRQEAGRYSIAPGGHQHCFSHVPAADSWKRFLFPPRLRIFAGQRDGGSDQALSLDVRLEDPPRYAFVGVRACELAAIAIQDKVLTSEIADPYYQTARRQAFIVAVNCAEPGGTCFCASMGTGPRCARGFDLCLTELDGEFSVEVGSEQGAMVFAKLASRAATASERRLHELILERSREHMGRQMAVEGLPELLTASLESPRWQAIARRCLACANCTMVCPTCFCYSVQDASDLSRRKAERWRLWGSCFTLEFSYLGSHTVRSEGYSRYRQWMTHKLGSWHEQFGMSGCVGCGRCITWCPVGIDITAEAAAFRQEAGRESTDPATARVREAL
jgi:formate hydrogenlyase subunit 6/NADH:ubiquinone oxidoreductase subunit I